MSYSKDRVVKSLFRPFVAKYFYFVRELNGMQYQMPQVFPKGQPEQNKVICFCVNAKDFYVMASDRVFDLHFAGDTQCLPLHRYTDDGKRVSNITRWGIQRINDHYRQEWAEEFEALAGPDSITAEDIFAYTYAVLHDPVYRRDYAVDVLREFPRLPLYHDFDHWVVMGRRLLDLHIGFESAEPFPLERQDRKKATPRRALLRADKERGTIALDGQTTLTGVPAKAWEYRLGSRSALEWVLDQYKERKPRDPTIAAKFNTYKFADHKEQVIDLLRRVCTVSVETMEVVDSMAHWEDGQLYTFLERDRNEMAMLALSQWADEPEDEEWLEELRELPCLETSSGSDYPTPT